MSLSRSFSHNELTNRRNKPKLKATRKRNTEAKDLGNLRYLGWTVRGDQVDSLQGHCGQSENATRTTSTAPRKNRRSVANPRTVRPARTVRQPRADSPANLLKPKTPNPTDRNNVTQELATNTTNSQLLGSSRTVHRPGADGLPGADGAARVRKCKHGFTYPSMDLPNGLSS
jgi:hypothetical protein